MCVLGGNRHRARRDLGEGLCSPWTAEPRLPFCPCPGNLAPLPSRDPFVLFHTSRFPCCSALSGECLPSSLSLAKPSPWPLLPLTSPSWVCCSEIPPCLLSLLLIWRTLCRFCILFVCFTSTSFFNNTSLPHWQQLYFIQLFGFSY